MMDAGSQEETSTVLDCMFVPTYSYGLRWPRTEYSLKYPAAWNRRTCLVSCRIQQTTGNACRAIRTSYMNHGYLGAGRFPAHCRLGYPRALALMDKIALEASTTCRIRRIQRGKGIAWDIYTLVEVRCSVPIPTRPPPRKMKLLQGP